MIRLQPTVLGGASATFGTGATITLSAAYNGGTLVDGSHYVIAPHGLDVAFTAPAAAVVDGRAGHGAMSNIQINAVQALDAAALDYSAGAAMDTTMIYRPGSCLVKVQSSNPLDPAASGRAGLFDATTALHVVSAAPAFRAMAPVVWPSADLANRPWRVADIDGFLAAMPVLASTGATTWATLSAHWDKLDFARSITSGISYQYLTPRRITGTDSAYDQYRAEIAGRVWAGICGNEWSTADKTAATIRMMSNGCQILETYRAFVATVGSDGGQHQSYLASCLAWLKATGQSASYAAVMPRIGGQLLGQYYQVTAGQFDPHDSAILPYIARRRTVSAITGSGPFVVTCTDYRPASGLTGDTASNADFRQLNLVRESNSATALITASAGTGVGTGWQFTVAALPTGLIVGNVVYCAQVTPMSVGTYDWTVRDPVAFPNLPNPSPFAEYRTGNHHGNNLLPISAMRMRGSDLAPCKAYVERISAADAYGGGSQVAFWSTHQATILAMPQIV